MLRVVFFGMELRILDELRRCPVHLLGAHLPPAPYQMLAKMPAVLRPIPKVLVRKKYKTASLFMSLYNYLSAHQIPEIRASSINSPTFLARLEALKPDLGVVANFGQIFRSELIAIPKYGLINYHPSLLPHYRGPSPLGHILLNQEKRSGVTWHRIAPGVDQGDILYQKDFPVHSQDNLNDLENTAIHMAKGMLHPLLESIANKTLRPVPQEASMATHYPKLTLADKTRLKTLGKLS